MAQETIYKKEPLTDKGVIREAPKVAYWEIRFVMFNHTGECVGIGSYYKRYKRKGNAKRIAKKLYGDPSRFSGLFTYSWTVIGLDALGRIVEHEMGGEKE